MINPEDRSSRRRVSVLGRRMSLVDQGRGAPIVFLHGNGTWSYMWRNLVDQLNRYGRCLAPDLLGMGHSDLLRPSGRNTYTLAQQMTQLDALFLVLELDRDIVFVAHELGAVLAADWARRHPGQVRGIAVIEGVVGVVDTAGWRPELRELVDLLRSEQGEVEVLTRDRFFSELFPSFTIRRLSEREMRSYTEPFSLGGEFRRPILTMLRELPLSHATETCGSTLEVSFEYLKGSKIPTLIVEGDPGYLLKGRSLEEALRWNHVSHVEVTGTHLLVEDSPALITEALKEWLDALPR